MGENFSSSASATVFFCYKILLIESLIMLSVFLQREILMLIEHGKRRRGKNKFPVIMLNTSLNHYFYNFLGLVAGCSLLVQ